MDCVTRLYDYFCSISIDWVRLYPVEKKYIHSFNWGSFFKISFEICLIYTFFARYYSQKFILRKRIGFVKTGGNINKRRDDRWEGNFTPKLLAN